MEIEFDTRSLEKLCNNAKEIVRKFGQPGAKKLMQRLGELGAANCLAEIHKLPQAKLHQLNGTAKGQWALTIHGGLRLVIEPQPKPAFDPAGTGVDLSLVRAVRVVFVGDYHD